MHALRRIHRSLRDNGVLLDVHPQPVNSRLEVWQENRVHSLGEIEQEQDIREIVESRACLTKLENESVFETIERRFFDMFEHYPSVEAWLERWNRKGWVFAVSNEVLESARGLLTAAGGELIVREPVRASLLQRLPVTGRYVRTRAVR